MQIIPIASGKGGVGKSLISANLAIALGQANKKVVLADLDLGASNLHLVIGHQAPKVGLGTYLTGQIAFEDIIIDTEYPNLRFIPGDSEIPGLTSLKLAQKKDLIRNLQSLSADYLILDLGAGAHLTILDLFLMTPQAILVTAPTVTATLNGYLFLKNTVFRMMYNTFGTDSKAYAYLEEIKKDPTSLQKLYVPKLLEKLEEVDPSNVAVFRRRLNQLKPQLILNMIDDPRDADKALKIRRSCNEYLGLDLNHLGVVYRDTMQDKALVSRLPIIIYKPQSLLSQSIYRIAEKIMTAKTISFDADFNSFDQAESEAEEDFETKISYVEDLLGTGALTTGDLAETIKSQQYEITQLRKENQLLKSKLVKAASQGFKI